MAAHLNEREVGGFDGRHLHPADLDGRSGARRGVRRGARRLGTCEQRPSKSELEQRVLCIRQACRIGSIELLSGFAVYGYAGSQAAPGPAVLQCRSAFQRLCQRSARHRVPGWAKRNLRGACSGSGAGGVGAGASVRRYVLLGRGVRGWNAGGSAVLLGPEDRTGSGAAQSEPGAGRAGHLGGIQKSAIQGRRGRSFPEKTAGGGD